MKKRQKVRLVLEFELTIQTDDKKDNWEEWEWLLAIEEFDAEEAINFWGIYRPICSANTGTLEANEIRREISGIGYEEMKSLGG